MRSLTQLAESLNGVRKLAELEATFADPPAEADRLTSFSLRGACIVLTVASFEAFLRGLFEEQLDRLSEQQVPLAHYPERFRVNAIYSSLELAMKGDHTSRGQSKADRLQDVSKTAKLVSIDSFSPRALSDTQSNPDVACIKRLFKNVDLGQDNFVAINRRFSVAWPTPVPLTFVETTLDALVQSRHRVAHSADAAHIARAELIQYCNFVQVLAETLSAILADHIEAIILSARDSFSSSLRP